MGTGSVYLSNVDYQIKKWIFEKNFPKSASFKLSAMYNDKPFVSPFMHSAHQKCMNFAKIGYGPCYYHWKEFCAGVGNV